MDLTAPFTGYRDVVRPEWIDHNQHMNMGYYMVVFDYATDAFFDYIGMTRGLRAEHGGTTFSLEGHITYQREVREGDPLVFSTRVIDYNHKLIHYVHEMYHAEEGYLASTNELMSVYVSLETRRSAPMPQVIQDNLAAIKRAHDRLGPCPYAGRRIGLAPRK